MNIISKNRNQIYIPLWFYSNGKTSIQILLHLIFTFHYGSILITSKALNNFSPTKFTFHYGSILILLKFDRPHARTKFTFHYGSILIKPLFYFDVTTKRFTFHYGSILIWCLPIWNSPVIIYIPLWFYSNLRESLIKK